MATRNVVLTERQEEFLGELLASGRYRSASEVLGEGLRLLEEQAAHRSGEVEAIRSGLEESLGQEARGEFAEGAGEEVVRRAFSRGRHGHTA